MSAENAWRIAMEAAAEQVPSYEDDDMRDIADAIQVTPMPPAFRAAVKAEVASMRARKDAAYEERNRVVAALAHLFPSGTKRTDIPGWDDEWHGCVYIDTPAGQLSWHFHDSQAYLFADLPAYSGDWDGHDTPEKYRRLAAVNRAAVEAETEELRGMLAEALPLVEEREYLAEMEFSYGSGWPEPSPAEWGIHCGYQQSSDAMPYAQFCEEVERYHRTNREEDDGDGEFLTLANRIRATLSKMEVK